MEVTMVQWLSHLGGLQPVSQRLPKALIVPTLLSSNWFVFCYCCCSDLVLLWCLFVWFFVYLFWSVLFLFFLRKRNMYYNSHACGPLILHAKIKMIKRLKPFRSLIPDYLKSPSKANFSHKPRPFTKKKNKTNTLFYLSLCGFLIPEKGTQL